MRQKVDRVQDKIEKVENIPDNAEWKLDSAEDKLDVQLRFENQEPKGTLERIRFGFWKAFRGKHDDAQAWENIFVVTGLFGGYILITGFFMSLDFWIGAIMWLALTFFMAGLFQDARKGGSE